ncbi:MAG: hypothetical protein ABIZ91_02720, partial [Gemmatimonadaceae bacterium]
PSTPRASGAWWIGPTAVIAVAAVIATAGTMLLGQTSLAERLRTPPARAAAARRTQADAPPPAATPPAAGGRANAADRPGRAARPNASGRASLRTRAKRTLVGIGKFFGIPFVATLGVLLLVRLARRGPAPSEREVLEEQVG